jgi:hypothetical protein
MCDVDVLNSNRKKENAKNTKNRTSSLKNVQHLTAPATAQGKVSMKSKNKKSDRLGATERSDVSWLLLFFFWPGRL